MLRAGVIDTVSNKVGTMEISLTIVRDSAAVAAVASGR